jgi:predicted nucleotidyltransferase
MKKVGIIAEFNPFHNGHKYILDYARNELGADQIIVAMSGDFMRSGIPCVISK